MDTVWNILKAVVYGIVEGVTEWLPVSSTGHLILLEQVLPLDVSDGYMDMFNVVIQFGAILAVVLMFWKRLWPFDLRKKGGSLIKKGAVPLWSKILVSCVPAAVVGVLWDDFFESLFYNPVSVSIALIVVGVAFLVIEWANRAASPRTTDVDGITYIQAAAIGLFQVAAAVFPGTSRSGAIIMGALLLGLSRKVAAEYAFLLAVPTMCGASLLKLMKFGFDFSGEELIILLVGMVVSFGISLLVIGFLLDYVRKHDFRAFGYYRIALGAVVLTAFFSGVFY